ncbi:Serine/threonine-protein kinase KIN82 [Diplonema papillatum]|nr:Serine/threonine-protein kinase KIN82 [Diplonema papillatum]|eukprot:gene6193-9483_t
MGDDGRGKLPRRVFVMRSGRKVEETRATDFRVVRTLGKGDVGEVYLVQYKPSGEHYAMKVVSKESILRRKKYHRLQTEWEILRGHDHPFLVRLYWCFQSATKVYFVLEYCEGGELFRLLQKQRKGRLPEEHAKFYAAEVILALEYLHLNGYVYRDLKPENILVKANGHIVLADFDLSKKTSAEPQIIVRTGSSKASLKSAGGDYKDIATLPTQEGFSSFVGTAEYIAPEVLLNTGHNYAVDWWGLGILIWEMLYGTTPFRGKDQAETFDRISCGELPPFPSKPAVSKAAKRLMQALLRPDVATRLGSTTGAIAVKNDPWFSDVTFSLLRNTDPPMHPPAPCKSETPHPPAVQTPLNYSLGPLPSSTSNGSLAAADASAAFGLHSTASFKQRSRPGKDLDAVLSDTDPSCFAHHTTPPPPPREAAKEKHGKRAKKRAVEPLSPCVAGFDASDSLPQMLTSPASTTSGNVSSGSMAAEPHGATWPSPTGQSTRYKPDQRVTPYNHPAYKFADPFLSLSYYEFGLDCEGSEAETCSLPAFQVASWETTNGHALLGEWQSQSGSASDLSAVKAKREDCRKYAQPTAPCTPTVGCVGFGNRTPSFCHLAGHEGDAYSTPVAIRAEPIFSTPPQPHLSSSRSDSASSDGPPPSIFKRLRLAFFG